MLLKTRQLGCQGLEVGAIGLGYMGMSQSYGLTNEEESISTFPRAPNLGHSFLDTAQGHGPFKNEKLLGRALRDRRDKVVPATKFGLRFENRHQIGAELLDAALAPGAISSDRSPNWVMAIIDR